MERMHTDSDKLVDELRIRIINQADRDNPFELFNAMGAYMEALQKFNTLILHSVEPNIEYNFKFEKVEYSSLVSVVKEWSSRLPSWFNGYIHKCAAKELEILMSNDRQIDSPREIFDMAHSLETRIKKTVSLQGIKEPYIDPIKLAEVLERLSAANEDLMDGESVEVYSGTNVFKLNSKFKSNVKASKLGLEKQVNYNGYDNVKVIRPCNFGRAQWEVKSTSTNDTYYIKFSEDCDWLERYQSGKIGVVTAKHTLRIKVSYVKYTLHDKKTVIKDAVVSSVSINEDPDSSQTKFEL